jgi:hypothetical protein
VVKDSYLTMSQDKTLREKLKEKNLSIQSEAVHQSACRYSLVDFLSEEFGWNYWMVITFGYNPQRSDCEQILQDAHLRFDRWTLTNNKLEFMNVKDRSRWVCLPERGDGHRHYNCFLEINTPPQVKTYKSEWDVIRRSMQTTLSALQTAYELKGKIEFRLYERKYNKDDWKMAIYSTKEMSTRHMYNNNGEDHFADSIMSWNDWNIQPISRRTPVKIQPRNGISGTLDAFMS